MTYSQWLIHEIHGEEYSFLLKRMHEIDFYWSDRIPIDENRAKDGLKLRETYDILAVSEHWDDRNDGFHEENRIERPCSVLEMMIALAQRVEFETMSDGYSDRSTQWFWVMMSNLNLDFLTDQAMSYDGMSYAEMVIMRWLDRNFGPDGSGSPYPTRRFGREFEDLRNADIYSSFQWYLNENWDENQ